MDAEAETPPVAIVLMKMALGLIDAAGQRDTAAARHLNAAVEIAMGTVSKKPEPLVVSQEPIAAD